jgi:hypothetical protein
MLTKLYRLRLPRAAEPCWPGRCLEGHGGTTPEEFGYCCEAFRSPRAGCNPGATLLLLPPSLLRPGALRSIFLSPPTRHGWRHEGRHRRLRHRRPGRRAPLARPRRRHPVRGRRLVRRPHPHRRRHPARRGRAPGHARRRHRVPGLQRTHLPAADPAAGRPGVPTAKSDMSFSVQVPGQRRRRRWSGAAPASRPCSRSAATCCGRASGACCATCCASTRWPRASRAKAPKPTCCSRWRSSWRAPLLREFRDWYFLPMIGCIWSCPTDQMLRFPVGTMIRFCHNHGLLQVADRPQWWTVAGGARQYVEKIVAASPTSACTPGALDPARRRRRARLQRTRLGKLRQDGARHPSRPGAVAAAGSVTGEQQVLGAIRYQPNRAVLHTDVRMLPQRRAAWAAWNYEGGDGRRGSACTTCSTSCSRCRGSSR